MTRTPARMTRNAVWRSDLVVEYGPLQVAPDGGMGYPVSVNDDWYGWVASRLDGRYWVAFLGRMEEATMISRAHATKFLVDRYVAERAPPQRNWTETTPKRAS